MTRHQTLGIDKIISALNILSIFFLVVSVAVTFMNVLLRYVFKSPFHWADELATLSLVAMVFLPIAVIEKTGDHLRLTILFQLFGERMKTFCEYLRVLATLAISIYFMVTGFPVIYQNYLLANKTASLKIPTALTFAPIPIAFSAVALVNLFLMLKWLSGKKGEIKSSDRGIHDN